MSQILNTPQRDNESYSERTARTRKSIFRLETKHFRSPVGLRIWIWAKLLRLALFAGYPVVLVGACRTGKSLLLHKITPGNVIDHSDHSRRGGRLLSISESDVSGGIYSIDECQLIEPQFFIKLMSRMATKQRSFCLATQKYSVVEDAIDTYLLDEKAKRILLVVVGGQSNPKTILKELPQ